MKKMVYGTIICEVSVTANCTITVSDSCDYPKDTIAYAVEKFFSRYAKTYRECTYESWQLRIAKGRKKRTRRFEYIIPAVFMELPGNWVRVYGNIDVVGMNISRIELLKDHPYFM